jgi:hypothetical protein
MPSFANAARQASMWDSLVSTNVPSKSKTTRRIILPPGEAAALG